MRSLKYLLFTIVLSFIALSNVSASEVCTYSTTIDGAKFTYECTVGNSISCGFKNISQVSYKEYKNGTISEGTEENVRGLESYDFVDFTGNIDCNQVKTLKMFLRINYVAQVEVFGIGSRVDYEELANIEANPSYKYTGQAIFKLENASPNKYENDPDYIAAKEDADKYCNEQDSVNFDNAKCDEAKKEMQKIKENYEVPDGADDTEFDTETFCYGPVQGVFTTLGWVFFILKILIPIILIVFGSIDFGKAMLANKDDEIKKSAKTLVMRAIAGIIIFFIPTLLNFVVELIGGDDIYDQKSGTFARCTHCMLEPTDGSCRKLVDNQ